MYVLQLLIPARTTAFIRERAVVANNFLIGNKAKIALLHCRYYSEVSTLQPGNPDWPCNGLLRPPAHHLRVPCIQVTLGYCSVSGQKIRTAGRGVVRRARGDHSKLYGTVAFTVLTLCRSHSLVSIA